MEVKALGRIRKLLEGVDAGSPGDDEQLALNPQLEQLIAPGSSPYGEIVRLGRAFYTGTTTAVASVVALPTTAVALALYNNDVDGGRSLIIDWVAAINIVAGAATGQSEIIANLGQTRATPPTDQGLAIKKANPSRWVTKSYLKREHDRSDPAGDRDRGQPDNHEHNRIACIPDRPEPDYHFSEPDNES